jgi:hypothetical protein
MDSESARAMLAAICLQESGLTHRLQIGGPARGFPQFEKAGIRGVLEHRATADLARRVCDALVYMPNADVVYVAVKDNDILALSFARLLLWTLPDALPEINQCDEGWRQYKKAWRPGRPKREHWDDKWDMAWSAVKQQNGRNGK